LTLLRMPRGLFKEAAWSLKQIITVLGRTRNIVTMQSKKQMTKALTRLNIYIFKSTGFAA